MIVGGLRARLLHDSLYHLVVDGLTELGWLDPNRTHRAIRVLAKPTRWDVPIEPNVIAFDRESVNVREFEVGSHLTEDTIVTYVEIYAQSDSLGTDLSNDIRDMLRGRLTTAALHGTFPIYDYRHATPPVIGYAAIDEVRAMRNAAIAEETWVRHWFRVYCEILDTYFTSEA